MPMYRLVLRATTIVALLALALLCLPDGAIGSSVKAATHVTTADQYHFGSDATIDQPFHGNVQVYGGNVVVRSVIDGDLVVVMGDVSVLEGGRVNGNVIYGGGHVTGLEGNVGGKIYPLSTLQGAASALSKSAVIASLLLVWLIAAIVVTLISGREVRVASIEVRVSALHCLTLGLVGFTSYLLTAIVFNYLVPYVVGIPLLAALAVFALLTKIFGLIAVFHAIGSAVAASRTREQLASRKWFRGDLAMVVLGALILGAVRLIPVVGPMAWALGSLFGIGTSLATKFGRREPWFLAWRPAEVEA